MMHQPRHLTVAGVAIWLAGAMAAPASVVAQRRERPAPTTLPVYPGAERYERDEVPYGTTIRETLREDPDGLPLGSKSIDTFIAEAPVATVDAFYRARLGGIASGLLQWKAADPLALAPGASTPVHAWRYQEAGTTNYVRHWYRKEASDDVALFEVWYAAHWSPDPRLANRKGPLTLIILTRKTYSRSAPSVTPSENDLGAPVYPGARYSSQESTTMSGGLTSHVFLSADPLEKVVAFYEGALGRKALRGEPPAGGVNWYFRAYATANPDDFINIESIDRPSGPYRTRIMFHLERIPPQ